MNDQFGFETPLGGPEGTQTEVRVSEAGDVRRDLNILFLLDCSGSMSADGRIEQLNNAMPEAIQAARAAATKLETATVSIRAIAFSDTVRWVLGDKDNGLSPDEALANWRDLSPQTTTNTAAAIEESLTMMHTKQLGNYNLNPVVILITDGASDNRAATQAAIAKLRMALTGGDPERIDKVWRFAIGVKDYVREELEDFAMLGKFEDEFGNQIEKQPMVFKVDDLSNLTGVLTKVTEASILSQVAGAGGGAAAVPVVPTDKPVDL